MDNNNSDQSNENRGVYENGSPADFTAETVLPNWGPLRPLPPEVFENLDKNEVFGPGSQGRKPDFVFDGDNFTKDVPAWVFNDPLGPELAIRHLIPPNFACTRKSRYAVVFGSARNITEGTPLWDDGVNLGKMLVKHGFVVVNGGYTGWMESTAQGARKAMKENGVFGPTIGVIVPHVFHDRLTANKHITTAIDAGTMSRRLDIQIRLGSVFIAMPGRIGTLVELTTVWEHAQIYSIQDPHKMHGFKIIAMREPWFDVLETSCRKTGIPESALELITFVDSISEIERHL